MCAAHRLGTLEAARTTVLLRLSRIELGRGMLDVFRAAKTDLTSGQTALDRIEQLEHQINALIAINQRQLDVLEQSFGLPRSDPYVFTVTNPNQNQMYYGDLIPSASILRSCIFTVQGGTSPMITIWLLNDHYPNGQRAILRGIGVANYTYQNIRARIPANTKIGITVSVSGVTTIDLTAFYDQVTQEPAEFWRGRS